MTPTRLGTISIGVAGALLIAITWGWPADTQRAQLRNTQQLSAESERPPDPAPVASAPETGPAAGATAPRIVNARPSGSPGRGNTPPSVAPDAGLGGALDDTTPRGYSLVHERLAQRWRDETDDPEWSHSAQESLADLADRTQLGSEVIHDVSCKQSICRAALRFSKLTDAASFAHVAGDRDEYKAIDLTADVNLAVHPSEPSAPTEGTQGPEPVRQYVVYMARPGSRISDLWQDGSR